MTKEEALVEIDTAKRLLAFVEAELRDDATDPEVVRRLLAAAVTACAVAVRVDA